MQTVLAALKDIPGVVGSFVMTGQGTLVAREMPAIFPNAIFPELGRRLVSVGEVMDAQMAPYQEMLLKFEGHWLFVRRTAECLLSVLTADNVNYPALRMAANLALRQVADQMPATPPPAPAAAEAPASPVEEDFETAAAPAPAPAPPPGPAPKTRPRRMWRGQVVD